MAVMNLTYTQFMGNYTAELAQGDFLPDLKSAYRTVLELDGVAFPSPELEEGMRLWDANAAEAHGVRHLNSDGTVVDTSSFNRHAVGELITSNRPALANAEKLDALTDLGLLAKAGALAVEAASEFYGSDSTDVHGLIAVTSAFKQFVQLSMLTEEWEQPWLEIVNNGFYGESVDLPLSMEDVACGLDLVGSELFRGLTRSYFHKITLYGFALYQKIDSSPGCQQYDKRTHSIAAQAGLFYRHSQAGCAAMIDRLIEIGTLPAQTDWHAEVQAAVKRADGYFQEA